MPHVFVAFIVLETTKATKTVRRYGPARWSATVVDGRVRRWQVDEA
jgi:hypothetical protein